MGSRSEGPLIGANQPEVVVKTASYVDGPGTPTAVFFDHGNGIGVAAPCWIGLSQANRRFAPGI
jgi:hypothetical protein